MSLPYATAAGCAYGPNATVIVALLAALSSCPTLALASFVRVRGTLAALSSSSRPCRRGFRGDSCGSFLRGSCVCSLSTYSSAEPDSASGRQGQTGSLRGACFLGGTSCAARLLWTGALTAPLPPQLQSARSLPTPRERQHAWQHCPQLLAPHWTS